MPELNVSIKEDIASIKTQIATNGKTLDEIKSSIKDVVKKLDEVENKNVRLEERVSNLTIFQTTLTVIIGAIASFLGVTSR